MAYAAASTSDLNIKELQDLLDDPALMGKLNTKLGQLGLPPFIATADLTTFNAWLFALLQQYFTRPDQSAHYKTTIETVTNAVNAKRTEIAAHEVGGSGDTVETKKWHHQLYIRYLTSIKAELTHCLEALVPDKQAEHFISLLVAAFNLLMYKLPESLTKLSTKDTIKKLAGRTDKKMSTTARYFGEIKTIMQQLWQPLIAYFHFDSTITLIDIIFAMISRCKWRDAAEPIDSSQLQSIKQEGNLEQHFTTNIYQTIISFMQRKYAAIANHNQKIILSLDLTKILSNTNTSIALFGCHGMDEFSHINTMGARAGKQHEVAELVRNTDPDMVMQLGDNVYYNGIGTFQGRFYENNKILYGIRKNFGPIFNAVVEGNHDYGTWGFYQSDLAESALRSDAQLRAENGLQRALNQVLHTYANNDHWHMPYRYYVLLHIDYAIVVIDSNTIIYDTEQQKWFASTVSYLKETLKIKHVIVAAHHPLIYLGKRAEVNCEWHKYLKTNQQQGRQWFANIQNYQPVLYANKSLIHISPPEKDQRHLYNNIGKFLLAFINANQLNIDVWACAHEHFLAVVKMVTVHDKTITQIISGGAGAEVKDEAIKFLDYTNGNITNLKEMEAFDSGLRTARCEFAAEEYGFFTMNIADSQITCQAHLIEGSESTRKPYGLVEGKPPVILCARAA